MLLRSFKYKPSVLLYKACLPYILQSCQRRGVCSWKVRSEVHRTNFVLNDNYGNFYFIVVLIAILGYKTNCPSKLVLYKLSLQHKVETLGKKLLSDILFHFLLITGNDGFNENHILCIIFYIIFGELNFSFLSALLRFLCLFLSGILFGLISLVLKFQSVL